MAGRKVEYGVPDPSGRGLHSYGRGEDEGRIAFLVSSRRGFRVYRHPGIPTTFFRLISSLGADERLGQPHAGRCQRILDHGDGAEQGH